LIDFPDLASYERYREKLVADPDGVESLRRAEAAGCILNEERSFVRRIPA
jgi:NIPSNAP